MPAPTQARPARALKLFLHTHIAPPPPSSLGTRNRPRHKCPCRLSLALASGAAQIWGGQRPLRPRVQHLRRCPPGFPNMPCEPGHATDSSGIPAAVDAASAASAAVVFVGLDPTSEAENFDRNNLTLPGVQKELVQSVLAAQPNTVVVLVNGGPVSSEWIASNVPAVVEAFYPGELGGDAIVDVLVGDYNPGGKMPYTVYPENFTDSRDIRDMDLSSNDGVTVGWHTGDVIYPFG